MGSGATDGNSPVAEKLNIFFVIVLEYPEERLPWGNPPALTGKAKYT